MSNSLRHGGLVSKAAAMTSRAPAVAVQMPPADNSRILSEITIRAVAVDQQLDDVGRQLDDLAKRIV